MLAAAYDWLNDMSEAVRLAGTASWLNNKGARLNGRDRRRPEFCVGSIEEGTN